MSAIPSGHGQKVTDPNAPVRQEGAGPVAADSLAAESKSFSQNRAATPLSDSDFPSANVSNATRLDPASDAEARLAEADWAEEKKLGAAANSYPDALGGQYPAAHSETAPGYIHSQYASDGKPKGKNLTEGGFESYAGKNASFNGDIGGKNDPGRLAEQKFQQTNAKSAASAGMPKQEGSTGGGQFDALGGDTSA